MIDRIQVYAAIDGEREYQEDRWKHTCAVEGKPYIPDFHKTTGMYLSYIAGYNADLLQAVSHVAGTEAALDVFRKLAALCVACMEFNGCCARDINTGEPLGFLEPRVKRSKVYAVIDTERTYQDELGSDRAHTVSGYVIMFQSYLNEAYIDWTLKPGDEYALNTIRKLAGVTVHAMEDHGVILREPFQV